jgi:hypothetical protein
MTYIPSRDEVESALAEASSIDPLACEVRRLRGAVDAAVDVGKAQAFAAWLEFDDRCVTELKTKLARVDEMPATLREMADGWLVDVRPAAEMRIAQATASALRAAAVMIETTLKDKP